MKIELLKCMKASSFIIVSLVLSCGGCSNDKKGETDEQKLNKLLCESFYEDYVKSFSLECVGGYKTSIYQKDGKVFAKSTEKEIVKNDIAIIGTSKIEELDALLCDFQIKDVLEDTGWFTFGNFFVDDIRLSTMNSILPFLWSDSKLIPIRKSYEDGLLSSDILLNSDYFMAEIDHSLAKSKQLFLSNIVEKGKFLIESKNPITIIKDKAINPYNQKQITEDSIFITDHVESIDGKYLLNFAIDDYGGSKYEGKNSSITLNEKTYTFNCESLPYFYDSSKETISTIQEAYEFGEIDDEYLSKITSTLYNVFYQL